MITYVYSDLNIFRFFMLVLMFVVSIMFLIVSHDGSTILLGWDGLGLVSYWLLIYITVVLITMHDVQSVLWTRRSTSVC
jgi:NADH:ubiquinone oxidoreductase subunit 5 (subunit L)/multisubunit Na+/H+ antiporter MnhA subunit